MIFGFPVIAKSYKSFHGVSWYLTSVALKALKAFKLLFAKHQ